MAVLTIKATLGGEAVHVSADVSLDEMSPAEVALHHPGSMIARVENIEISGHGEAPDDITDEEVETIAVALVEAYYERGGDA